MSTAARYRDGAAALLLAVAMSACSSPSARLDRMVAHAGLVREIVPGAMFRHVVYRAGPARSGTDLHVYIEGDGTPYLDRTTVAADPTPRAPLALELMLVDSAPSLYLGRPCYLGLAQDPGCDSSYWTLKRFSNEVVQSLTLVLERELARTDSRHVTLIGHSGGATLALLIAERVPRVERVITVAGNLDVGGWTRLHHYTPLNGSLDPMTGPPPRSGLELIHFAGGQDTTVPARMISTAAARLGGRVTVFPGFGHECCWERVWPTLLQGI